MRNAIQENNYASNIYAITNIIYAKKPQLQEKYYASFIHMRETTNKYMPNWANAQNEYKL